MQNDSKNPTQGKGMEQPATHYKRPMTKRRALTGDELGRLLDTPPLR